MTNESFAEHLTVSVRTVANWRGNPDVIPRPAIQDILDAALERAPDRVKAQFALLIGEAETGNQDAGHVESFEASLNATSNADIEGSELLEVVAMASAGDVRICNECLELCDEILSEEPSVPSR